MKKMLAESECCEKDRGPEGKRRLGDGDADGGRDEGEGSDDGGGAEQAEEDARGEIAREAEREAKDSVDVEAETGGEMLRRTSIHRAKRAQVRMGSMAMRPSETRKMGARSLRR